MAKKDMKSALTNSLKAEDAAVKDRFEKAESLFGDRAETDAQASPSAEQSDSALPKTPPKEEKQKVIRDSFTLPASDYELINAIKQRCLNSAINVTKSEVIRAGLHALREMSDEQLSEMMESLEKVKTGRPTSKP
jgi:hypothetical protein